MNKDNDPLYNGGLWPREKQFNFNVSHKTFSNDLSLLYIIRKEELVSSRITGFHSIWLLSIVDVIHAAHWGAGLIKK